jgi:gas vesicle protein
MRMGTLLIGGILGATAALYLTRNRSMMISSLGQNLDDVQLSDKTMNNISKTAKNVWNDMSGKAMSASSSHSQADLKEVEDLLRKDPQAKATVGEILSSNGESISSINLKQ